MIGTLVGGTVKVLKTSNESLLQIHGEVIDESKNTITLLSETGQKRLLRNAVILEKSNE